MREGLENRAAIGAVAGALAFFVATTVTSTAAAAPSRVAIIGPSESPIVERLQRNVASMKLDALEATVRVCSRDVVSRLLNELRVDTALCTDGDQIGVWVKDGDHLVLKESIAIQSSDDRAQELAAARAVMAMQSLPAKDAPAPSVVSAGGGGFTIVANGSEGTVTMHDLGAPAESVSPVGKDTAPVAPPPEPSKRYTPRLVLGVGPALSASRDGSGLAIAAEAEIGVNRYVALVPWMQFMPANRTTHGTVGTAEYRPTLFGFGVNIPILPPSSFIVPRLGTGYGILWMHVAPVDATGPGKAGSPEDLVAPVMYANGTLSAKLSEQMRLAVDGMAGFSTHDMVVRIGGEKTAHWGVPIASIALRGEWVLQ